MYAMCLGPEKKNFAFHQNGFFLLIYNVHCKKKSFQNIESEWKRDEWENEWEGGERRKKLRWVEKILANILSTTTTTT